jgi:hypothetical protein
MKKTIILALLIALIPTTAHAEEKGAWVAVDANGNAVSQAIVCTPSVCGNKENPFMGQHWVLQAPAGPDGNVAGVGLGQGPSSVKVDLQTGVWSVENKSVYQDPKTQQTMTVTSTQQFTSEKAPWVLGNLPVEVKTVVTPTIINPLIAQQEVTIANLYAQLEKVKKSKKVKKAKK